MKAQSKLEVHVALYPGALSSKHPWVVTCPDMERALVLWVHHMEEKGETVNGLMLRVKWARFEEQFNVPESEWLLGNGWIAPFCKAHGYKEHCQHGEAGSVDLEAVEAECKWVGMIMVTYAPQNRWNIDELALFAL